MILCLDCGNSRLKWGAHDGERWLVVGTLAYDVFDASRPPWPAVTASDRIVGCNVAGPAIAAKVEAAVARPIDWIASRASQCGVRNGYDIPDSLGADRWAALIGARAMHLGPLLVVMAGTATTIDVLDADGQHLGGVILAGLDMMTQALARGTAGLPTVDVTAPLRGLPRNTRDAIASGALQATIGAVRSMFAHIAQEPQPLCILSGGAAPVLQTLLDLPCRRVEHLVLDGLATIAAETAVARGRPA